MQSDYSQYQSVDASNGLLPVASSLPRDEVQNQEAPLSTTPPTRFQTHHVGCMEMHGDAQTVTNYLNAHQRWFCRCADPMHVEPLGDNAYVLVIGKFGAFGYDVEPKVGLELLPLDQGFYRMKTVPVPNYVAPGYEVDYQASMKLVEADLSKSSGKETAQLTKVEWVLDLVVDIHFPKFINRLPKSVIQNTGDALLSQIVRQVSRRLTHRVQEDFHNSVKNRQGSRGEN